MLQNPQTKRVELKQGIRIKFELPEVDLHYEYVKGFGPGG
jgi:hypothetical protein